MSITGNVWTQNRSKPSLTNTEFPSLNNDAATGDHNAGDGSINPAQAQEEEVEVLRAIYMEDYEELDSIAAWTVCHYGMIIITSRLRKRCSNLKL